MFIHLHVHSPFSFLDGASSLTNVVKRAAQLDMPSIALTDHNRLSGAVKFIKSARKYGLKPIIGCEVSAKGNFHLTLICKDSIGYQNLCSVLTQAHTENTRGFPVVDLNTLASFKEGLFILSGCRKGLIPTLILNRRFKEAKQVAENYKNIFGKNSFIIEMSESLLPGSMNLNRALLHLAENLNLHTVVTNNVHYVSKKDFKIHDILTCIRTSTKLEDIHPERRLNSENYLKSEAEIKKEYKNCPEALYMTQVIAEQCVCPLNLDSHYFPEFSCPENFKSSNQFLHHLTYRGAQRKYGKITNQIKTRLEEELKVITHLGYADYFLVVWDLIRFATEQKIRYAGRGSAADSAVAHCLGITGVDPIAQNLLFERFMSIERGRKPDIDIDFDARRKDEITAYVYKKYGEEHVASVATYNTFRGRSSVREVGKVIGYSKAEIDTIAKRLHHIHDCRFEDIFKILPELKSLNVPENRLEILAKTASNILGFPKFLGTHLSGIVISKNPINWLSPLEYSAKGHKILQFDKDDTEDLGLTKIDLLSLRTLSAIEDSLQFMRTNSSYNTEENMLHKHNIRDIRSDFDDIPLNDNDTFSRLRLGDTVGIFQLESPAQRGLQSRLGANSIEDIVASVALIRPGPIKGEMVEPYIRRRHGKENITYPDPRLEPILKHTYGVILFQEQVIEIASKFAGFTPGEADNLRRVMTHGRCPNEMEKLGELFIKKAIQMGTTEQIASEIFSCIEGYASYGFCEAHARSFAATAYKTAYLIEHHPAEFYGALLNNQPMGYYPISTLCVEAKKHNVEILGPSINHSYKDIVIEGNKIRMSFRMIKDMKSNIINAILRERKKSKFKSFYNFTKRIKIDVGVLRNLILCGVFDDFGLSRRFLLWQIKHAYAVDNEPRSKSLLQYIRDNDEPRIIDNYPGVADFSLKEKVDFEYQILGTGISAHPMEMHRDRLKKQNFVASHSLSNLRPGDFIKTGGIPIRPHRPPTKSGKTVVFLSLEDEYGLIDVVCFEDVYSKYGKFLFPGKIAPLGIWGPIQKRGNAFSVTAKTVFPLSYVL